MRDIIYAILILFANGAIIAILSSIGCLIIALFSKDRKKTVKAPIICIGVSILVCFLSICVLGWVI